MTRRSASLSDDFEQEVLSHLPSMMAVATRLTRNPNEAEDLVQDTCVKAFRARNQYSPGTNLRAWCLTILKNTFINRYRRGGLERTVLEGPDADPLADGWIGSATLAGMRSPEAAVLRPVLEGEINIALSELPEDFRVVVVLADVEELSYKEIAEVLSCPVGTVMSRLHRGRRLLKAKLLDQARALGVIQAEEHIGEHSGEEEQRSSTIDMQAFRAKKRGTNQ